MHSSRNIVSYRLVKRTSTVVLMFEFQMGIEKLLKSKYFQYNIAILTERIAISILGWNFKVWTTNLEQSLPFGNYNI